MRVVCHDGVFCRDGLSSVWSLVRVACHWGALLSGWSLISVIFHEGCHHGGLSSVWPVIRVVSHQGDLSSGLSVISVISRHGSLSSERPFIPGSTVQTIGKGEPAELS